jgi:type IV pilus assembly protein PilA
MKADFRAKFLNHLIAKKEDQGFTLIELLVVIIIIGILSAIALPSFLSQANKAKQSEAKTYVGAMNKGQQAYYTENSKFQASDISALGIGINPNTVNYTYTTVGTNGTTFATTNAVNKAQSTNISLKGYAGKVGLFESGTTSEVTSVAVLCEVKKAGTGAPADPTDGKTCDSATQDNVSK